MVNDMDKIQWAIFRLEVHFADRDEKLCNAWTAVLAELMRGQRSTSDSAMVPCSRCGCDSQVHYCKLCHSDVVTAIQKSAWSYSLNIKGKRG